jgi:hypothetical protein
MLRSLKHAPSPCSNVRWVNSATHQTYVAHWTEKKMQTPFQLPRKQSTLHTKRLPPPESSKDVGRERGRVEVWLIECRGVLQWRWMTSVMSHQWWWHKMTTILLQVRWQYDVPYILLSMTCHMQGVRGM